MGDTPNSLVTNDASKDKGQKDEVGDFETDKDEKTDGEDMKLNVTTMDKEYQERLWEDGENHERVPRRVYLQKADSEKFGYTSRCPGCISIL